MHDGNLRWTRAVPNWMGEAGTGSSAQKGRKVAWFAAAVVALVLAGCKEVPGPRYVTSGAEAERGRALIREVGCGACHEIPGIDWPKGRAAPSLIGFDDIGLIAGALPNTPANLAWFVQNAPEAKPGSAMPAMPLSEKEAADVAAYLYGLNDA